MTSNSEDKVQFSGAGVTCLVGGNNAGKSRTLSDIAALVHSTESATVVLNELILDKPAHIDSQDAFKFLSDTAVEQPAQGGAHPTYVPLVAGGSQIRVSDFVSFINNSENGLTHAASFFCQHWSAGSLSSYATMSLGHVGMGSPTSPLHRLYREGDLEEELSNLSFEVFEEQLTLDRANMDVRLRLGKVDVEVPLLSHPTLEYAEAVAALPAVADQGDGVRSFLGLALAVLAGNSQILLIDEPEAFLHPGQARALGRWLSYQALKRDIQVVVSTHNRDFVLGLLAGAEQSEVRIVRIVRNGKFNRLHELPPADVAVTWEDPVLRYSNVLQGLFHRRVAICESDSDCRFYGAVLDELGVETNRRAQVDDILLVPSGGKQRVASLARALGQLGVETHAFVDFDVLNNRDTIKKIVDSVGGQWTASMQTDFLAFVQPVQTQSLWGSVKHQGIAAVPSGNAYAACLRLLDALKQARVHVVPVGEIEGFDRSNSLHGSAWVSASLEAGIHKTSQAARELVGRLLTS